MMKYGVIILCAAAFFTASCSSKMKMVKTDKTDSIAIEAVWKQYFRALSGKNLRTLKRLSLQQVYCQPCAIQTGGGDLVTADAFAKSMFTYLPRTRLWEAVKTSRHLIVTEKIKNYKPLNLSVNDGDVLVHDIWYVTRQPDKIKGFESQRYAFQFVKDGGQYKFFGLTAVR
jgi:hypothetical protein